MGKTEVTPTQLRAKQLLVVLKKLFPPDGTMLIYKNPFELLTAVILSAQCTDKQVNKVTPALFAKYPDAKALSTARLSDVTNIIKSTGFYFIKAQRIVGAAKKLVQNFDGKVPEAMETLITLPGVGRKTANVVLCNAFKKSVGIAVDTHVKRFAIKFDLSKHKDPKRIERDLMELYPKREWLHLAYYMINYGRHVCPGRKHDCTNHPCSLVYPPAAQKFPKAK